MLDGETHARVGMENARACQPVRHQRGKARPRDPGSLAPSAEHPSPGLHHLIPKRGHAPVASTGSCPRCRSCSRSSRSLVRSRLAMAFRRTINCPVVRVSPQMWVKPKKLKVSGFPSSLCFRFSTANRPNSMRRAFSGCNSKPKPPQPFLQVCQEPESSLLKPKPYSAGFSLKLYYASRLSMSRRIFQVPLVISGLAPPAKSNY